MKSFRIQVCLLAVVVASSAAAQDYLPLQTGNFWSYVAADGAREMLVVADPVQVFGTAVHPIEHPISPANAGLVNYWTSSPGGDVLLYGFFRDGWGYLYQPPIPLLSPPLTPGRTWTATFDLYSLPDTIHVDTYEMTLEVTEMPLLVVPAGEFATVGIGPPDPGAKTAFAAGYTLWGTRRDAKSGTATEWYAADVGLVQRDIDRRYQLETWTDQPVPTAHLSWGSVKALYNAAD